MLDMSLSSHISAFLLGECERWFAGCDEQVKAVASTVNGPLLVELAKATDFGDTDCIEFFRLQ